MEIYLTGSHGTGKTSVASHLAEYYGLDILPSASRLSPHKQGTREHQDYVMSKVYDRCRRVEEAVFDRTPVDVFAYTQLFEIKDLYEEHKMKCRAFLHRLGVENKPIFYFRPSFELVSDGIRPGLREQRLIDKYIQESLNRYSKDFIIVPNGTIEDRADFIADNVDWN